MITAPSRLLISDAQIYLPDTVASPGWLLTDGSRIVSLGVGPPPALQQDRTTRHINAAGRHLLPGFIDVHVHGAVGHEVMDASADGLVAMARFFARHGVTAFLPTTWTASPEATRQAVAAVAEVVGPVAGGASIAGVHLEGPYLNAAKCGAQDPRYIRRADRVEAGALLDSGIVRLVALAPEFEENLLLVDECARRGVTAAVAHTAATYDQVQAAAHRGITHATHTFNAMTAFSHREPGAAGAVMTIPAIRCELIADNIHVHPAAMQLLVAVKGRAGVILVTDAIRATGMPDGRYAIDTRTIVVHEGAARLPDGTLAGSVLTMDVAFCNAVAASGRSLAELWPLTSRNAARAAGLSATKGTLEPGKDADLVLIDDAFAVHLTVTMGAVVYEAN